jgi:hypothetical protein
MDTSTSTTLSTDGASSASTAVAGTTVQGATSTASPDSNKGVSTSHHGLSQGAKVGLGVGFGIAATLLILLLAYFFTVRRRKRNRTQMMDPKYTAQAQSELSMVDPSSYPVPSGPPRSAGAPIINTTRHSQALYEQEPPPLPLHDHYETPVSAIEQKDGFAYSDRHSAQQTLTLKIPGTDVESVRSRDLSPVHGDSPVSPVSPVSAIRPAVSRSPSPNNR